MRQLALPSLIAVLLTAAPAFAACQGESLFECRIGKKDLEVCRTGSAVSYLFGPPGKPEMQIATALSELDYQPWPGIGRTMWEAVSFTNAGVTYEVWSSFDRLDENAITEGGVNVLKGGKTVATLNCNRGTVDAGLDLLYGAKEGVGQCWNYKTGRWETSPCP
ncbi:hypothetical protein [Pseudogemmobacter bohemicus]|uniref:hypothetical protein n=1 Tax=Pseudogemmobacter bohemicus TaxID=2250708 RepID=UPI00130093B3|nr:hypothetical protein [Pseudogemmobacter bohemicus]